MCIAFRWAHASYKGNTLPQTESIHAHKAVFYPLGFTPTLCMTWLACVRGTHVKAPRSFPLVSGSVIMPWGSVHLALVSVLVPLGSVHVASIGIPVALGSLQTLTVCVPFPAFSLGSCPLKGPRAI